MIESGDYIYRNAAIEAMYKDAEANPNHTFWASQLEALRNIPAADVRPVVRGKWIDMGDFISCSSCNATRLKEFESDYGKVMRLDARANYCPNCGADMRGESDV